MSVPKDFTSCQESLSEGSSAVTDTGRRRQGGNASDEQSPPEKRQKKTQTLPKRSGVAHDGGQQFEIKMAAVIGLRGMARGDDFQLSTNKLGSGNFDDLVYTTGTRRYFLQLKHTDNPDTTKLVHSDLVPLLHQCFESYCSTIQDLTDEELESSEFIIYTNKQLGPKLLKHSRQPREINVIFKTYDEGKIFNFNPDENKENDVYTLVEKKVKESKEFGDLSPQEREVKLKMISEFLKKMIMITGQKGQKELDDVIIEEIRKMDAVTVDTKVYEAELRHFKTPLESWWRNKNETMTPGNLRKWLQEAKTEVCASDVKVCTKKLGGTGINFSDSEISRLRTELSNNRAVHLRSDALTLCSILLLDCLGTSKCIFVTFESLQSNKNMLLHAWLGGHWEWLIVFCDKTVQQRDISDTCIKISEIIKRGLSSKRAAIMTLFSVQQISNFDPVEHKFKFEHLSQQSQEMVLDKKVDFQGCEVTLRSVLQPRGNEQHVLGPKLVRDLVAEGTAVNIGGRLQVNEDHYEPRVLERKLWLHTNFLRTAKDIIVVSGTTEEDLRKTLSSGKTVESVSLVGIKIRDFTQDMSGSIFVLSDTEMENSFQAICEKFEGKTLHWVEFNNRDLLWKKSQGRTDSLLDYIDIDKTRADKLIVAKCLKGCTCEVNEDSIWKLGERTVLVVDEPGMGKSSTTTQVARNTKLADPTSWVVRINWNDYSRKLQEIDTTIFNLDSLVEFLCSAAFPDSKHTDINRSLLKQALQNSGNVTVLMDGFDEISPIYADKAAVILSELMKTKVRRVWVTSRPVEKERLEKVLSVIAFSMKRLSRECQVEMLRKLFKEGKDKNKVESLLSRLNESVHDENFTGSPLYITMIPTVYEKHLDSENWWCLNIDLADMYEVFVESKLRIFLTRKQKADITNPSVLHEHEYSTQKYLDDFEKCALVTILPPSILESLHNKKIEEEIQEFLDRVQAGKDKTGIVMNVVEGKPQFVHRTFTEFFIARWFSRNFKDNRCVLERILFDPEYSFVRDMFDRMLTKDCPLHCAVLKRDREAMENLLKEGSDVNALDKGGRTVMHIFVTKSDIYWNDINRYLKYKDYLDITDSVLNWTPLQYAIKSEDWFIVERLLKSNVDRSGLDMIKQGAQDAEYIHPIIIQAAQYGYLSLLQFLCSIGVNIHQARSRGFLSPLHAAIAGQQLEVTNLLIEQGADCNTRYSDGKTPLFHAVNTDSLEVVQALMEKGGASPDILDAHGNTVSNEATRSLDISRSCCSDAYLENRKKIVDYIKKKEGQKESESNCFLF